MRLTLVVVFLFASVAGLACDPGDSPPSREEFAEEFDATYCAYYRECNEACPRNMYGMGDHFNDCTYDEDAAERCLDRVHEVYDDLSCGRTPENTADVCSPVFDCPDPSP